MAHSSGTVPHAASLAASALSSVGVPNSCRAVGVSATSGVLTGDGESSRRTLRLSSERPGDATGVPPPGMHASSMSVRGVQG